MKLKELFSLSPWRFCLAFILQMAGGISEVVTAYFLTLQFDALQHNNFQLFLNWTALQLLMYVFTYLGYNLAAIIWQRLVQEYLHLIRQELTTHYFADNKDHIVSKVQNRMTNDLEILHTDYLNSVRFMSSFFVSIASVTLTLLTFQWSLLIACIIFAAGQIYLPKLLDQPLMKATEMLSQTNQKYLKNLGDWLIGLSEIRRYFAADQLFNSVAKNSGKLENAYIEKEKVDQKLDYLNQLAYSVGDSLIFLLTAVLVINNWAAFGLVASIGNFNAAFFASLQGIASYGGRIRATKKLREEMLSDRQKIEQTDTGQEVAAFATKNLKINFANGEGVTFPDITVKAGEKILLTGNSGVGKSTLFKLILGEEKPSEGEISYFNNKGEKIKPNLKKIGYLPQDSILFPATIVENITMFNYKLQNLVKGVTKKVQLAADLAKFSDGVETMIDLDHLNVSGGQRQKIVLARNLLGKRKLLLIDEGTSAIDQAATFKILQNLMSNEATIVFIAHNFDTRMKDLFDREIRLENKNDIEKN